MNELRGAMKVWWHCLWRMFTPGHRWCEGTPYPEYGNPNSTVHYCECGFNLPERKP